MFVFPPNPYKYIISKLHNVEMLSVDNNMFGLSDHDLMFEEHDEDIDVDDISRSSISSQVSWKIMFNLNRRRLYVSLAHYVVYICWIAVFVRFSCLTLTGDAGTELTATGGRGSEKANGCHRQIPRS